MKTLILFTQFEDVVPSAWKSNHREKYKHWIGPSVIAAVKYYRILQNV